MSRNLRRRSNIKKINGIKFDTLNENEVSGFQVQFKNGKVGDVGWDSIINFKGHQKYCESMGISLGSHCLIVIKEEKESGFRNNERIKVQSIAPVIKVENADSDGDNKFEESR
eukprot:15562_1